LFGSYAGKSEISENCLRQKKTVNKIQTKLSAAKSTDEIKTRAFRFTGPVGVLRPRTRNPIQNVEAADGLHGHVAQKRSGRETAVQVHIAHDRGRFHNVPDRFPGGGPIWSRRVHARDNVAQVADEREQSPPQPSPSPARQRQRWRR